MFLWPIIGADRSRNRGSPVPGISCHPCLGKGRLGAGVSGKFVNHRVVSSQAGAPPLRLPAGATSCVAPLPSGPLETYLIRTSIVREFDAFVLRVPLLAATLQ